MNKDEWLAKYKEELKRHFELGYWLVIWDRVLESAFDEAYMAGRADENAAVVKELKDLGR